MTSRLLGVAMLAVFLATTLSACTPVQLRTQSAPISACDSALTSGRLVASAQSGLALAAADGSVTEVLWPFGYAARREATGIVLLDDPGPSGNILAREGDWVQIGGGMGGDGFFAACPASLTVIPPPG